MIESTISAIEKSDHTSAISYCKTPECVAKYKLTEKILTIEECLLFR